MIDPVAVAVGAIAGGHTERLPLVVVAGALTSLGPCVAPRYVAVAALLGEHRRMLSIATFVCGMLLAYMALGFGVGLLGMLAGHASVLYCALAAVLLLAGAVSLLREPRCEVHDRPAGARSRRLSAVFSLGAASALVVSPCCTPVVAVVAMMAADGNPLSRVLLLGAFALGHASPLFLIGSVGSTCTKTLRRWNASPAPAVVSGTLLVALGAYYGLLV